jgi:hypothetical protein
MTRILQCSALVAVAFAFGTFTHVTSASAAPFRQNYCLRMAGGNVDPNPVCYRSSRMCLSMRDRQIEYWRRGGVTIAASCAINLR